MSWLLSRVKKIEAQLVPAVKPDALLLREPGYFADDTELANFHAAVLEARQEGRVVVIHCSGAGHIKPMPGLQLADSAFDAWLAKAANSSAKVGQGDRLSEIIREVQGTSLPVIQEEKQ